MCKLLNCGVFNKNMHLHFGGLIWWHVNQKSVNEQILNKAKHAADFITSTRLHQDFILSRWGFLCPSGGSVATLEYLWVICIILSNFCNFSRLILSTHPLVLYQCLSPYQTFVVLSIFCHLLTLSYLFAFFRYLRTLKCTCTTHHTHNSLSCLIVRTLSAPVYLSYSPGVFGHRAILTMGGSDRGWGFPHRWNRFVSDPSVIFSRPVRTDAFPICPFNTLFNSHSS